MTSHPTSNQVRCALSFQLVSCAVAGLALATVLSQGTRCCAETPVRIPLPTDELLRAKPNQSIAELIMQVSTLGDDSQDLDVDDNAGSKDNAKPTVADALELGNDEPTDALKKETSASAGAEVGQKSDQSLRDQTTNKHLNQLRKPLREIEMKLSGESQTVPENKAASLSGAAAPFLIGSMGYQVPPPDRYTICQSHRPLFFEQPNLERCGNGFGVFQNAVSGATFLINTITLPCKMVIQRPDCEIPSGRDCKTCKSHSGD